MEIKLTDAGTFELLYDKLDLIIYLLAFGFTAAIVIAVVVAGIRIGWVLMPWILGLGLLAFLFT